MVVGIGGAGSGISTPPVLVGGAAEDPVTVTVAVAVTPFWVAVMVVVPVLLPWTRPWASTLAT